MRWDKKRKEKKKGEKVRERKEKKRKEKKRKKKKKRRKEKKEEKKRNKPGLLHVRLPLSTFQSYSPPFEFRYHFHLLPTPHPFSH